MAGVAGHIVIGLAIARIANLDRRQSLLAAALSLLPDADAALGLALKGDGHAWHRSSWSHSIATAVAVGAAAFLGSLAGKGARDRAAAYSEALKLGVASGLVVLSHVALDFYLDSPFELGGPPRLHRFNQLPGFFRQQLLNLPSEVLFYGSLAFTLYNGYYWLQQRLAQARGFLSP